jgi:cytochrome c-type biogenesis protein CcmF
MSVFGRAALVLALMAAIYAVVMALGSRSRGRRDWQASAERAVLAVFALVSVAIGTLWVALATGDFSLRNVADYTNETLGWQFKVTALWASQGGSLLLWAWLLTAFSAVVVVINRRRNRELMPVVVAVLMGIAIFFTSLLTFIESPFETTSPVPVDGAGLNPLLQNPYMIIHPPMLYLGYVGLAIPFAFAMAALVTRRLDTVWITSVRRWTIMAWLFLGIGMLLGARWAYEELGWGGYWAWDPVENAAFMPWLVATAFLHSVMVQERRGMLRVWNMVLVILSFSLAIFGTFLTRSGILNSIHAFGDSTLGTYFLAFIVVIVVGSVALLISRLPNLRSSHSLESYVSREAIFLFNNLLLVGLAFAVFWGTMFPILSEAVRGERITVGQGYFNQVALPIGLALLVLTGVGPLVAWRKASPAQLGRRFLWPLAAAAASAPLLAAFTDAWDRWAAGVVFTTGVFVFACITGEFWRGMKVRHALGGISWPGSLVALVSRNRRRYGGYLVHLAIVVFFVGLAGSRAFVTEGDLALTQGQSGRVGDYTFVNEGGQRIRNEHYMGVSVRLGVFKDGERIGTMVPERRAYLIESELPQPSTEVAIDSKPARDIYVVLASLTPNGLARLAVFVNPLVMWLWISGVMVLLGTLVAAWPAARAPARAPVAAEGDAQRSRA